MKTKQWFLDRVGKEVLRDLHVWETKINTSGGFKTVFIVDELQAQYMFDLQQELYHDSNVNLNYRDKMIRTEELRIGNYVKSVRTGGVIEVDWVAIKYVHDGNTLPPAHGMGSVYEPIPLTEEVLLKCGFVKSSNKLMFLPMPKIKAELHYEKHNYGNVITIQSDFGMLIPDDIEYVHKLQNLYFALTGAELDINL